MASASHTHTHLCASCADSVTSHATEKGTEVQEDDPPGAGSGRGREDQAGGVLTAGEREGPAGTHALLPGAPQLHPWVSSPCLWPSFPRDVPGARPALTRPGPTAQAGLVGLPSPAAQLLPPAPPLHRRHPPPGRPLPPAERPASSTATGCWPAPCCLVSGSQSPALSPGLCRGGSHGTLSPRPDEGGWRATLQRHRPHAPARAGTRGGPGVHCSLRVTGRPCTRHPRGRPFPAACRGRDRTGRWGAWRAHPSVHSLPPASVRHVRRPSRSCPFPRRPRLWRDPLPHRAWGPGPLGSETGSSISTAASPVCSSLSSEAPAVPASRPAPALRLPLVALGALTACASVHHPAACRRPLIANTVSLATSSVPWGGAGGPAQPLCLPRP